MKALLYITDIRVCLPLPCPGIIMVSRLVLMMRLSWRRYKTFRTAWTSHQALPPPHTAPVSTTLPLPSSCLHDCTINSAILHIYTCTYTYIVCACLQAELVLLVHMYRQFIYCTYSIMSVTIHSHTCSIDPPPASGCYSLLTESRELELISIMCIYGK